MHGTISYDMIPVLHSSTRASFHCAQFRVESNKREGKNRGEHAATVHTFYDATIVGVRGDGEGGGRNEGVQLVGAGHDAPRKETDGGRRDAD